MVVTHGGHQKTASISIGRRWFAAAMVGVLTLICAAPAMAQHPEQHPWMNKSLSPDERADMVLKEMTLAEKIDLSARRGHAGLDPVHAKDCISAMGARGSCWECRGWAFPRSR